LNYQASFLRFSHHINNFGRTANHVFLVRSVGSHGILVLNNDEGEDEGDDDSERRRRKTEKTDYDTQNREDINIYNEDRFLFLQLTNVMVGFVYSDIIQDLILI
jgi:hypothetical protein